MYKEHPSFTPPCNNAVLWRYMDFTKFISLLDTSSLFFARADKLGDLFEGTYSRVNMALQPILYADRVSENSLRGWVEFTREFRRFTLNKLLA